MRIGQPQSLGRSVQSVGLEVHIAGLGAHRPGLSIRLPLDNAEGGRCPETIAIRREPEPSLVETGGHLSPLDPGRGPPDCIWPFPAFEGNQSTGFKGKQIHQVGPDESCGRPSGRIARKRRSNRCRPQSRGGGRPPLIATAGHRPHREGDPTGFQFPGVADFLGGEIVFYDPDVGTEHQAIPIHHESMRPFAAEQVGL